MFPPSSVWDPVFEVYMSVCVIVNSFYQSVLTHTHPGVNSISFEIWINKLRQYEALKDNKQRHKVNKIYLFFIKRLPVSDHMSARMILFIYFFDFRVKALTWYEVNNI